MNPILKQDLLSLGKGLLQIVSVLLFLAFGVYVTRPETTSRVESGNTSFSIIEIDNCEYVFKDVVDSGYLAHKGNCRYCAERKPCK